MNKSTLMQKLNGEEKRLIQRTQDSKLVNEISSLDGSIMTLRKIRKWIE